MLRKKEPKLQIAPRRADAGSRSTDDPRSSHRGHEHSRDWSEFFTRYYSDDTVLAAIVQQSAYHEPAYERLRRLLSPGARVLDVGCGAGPTVIYLSGSGYRAVGIDRDESLLRRAAELVSRFSPNAKVALGDALAIPYPDASFDACVSFGVLEHFDDTEIVRALHEQRRVASFVMSVLPTRWMRLGAGVQDERFFSRRDLVRLHSEAGLDVIGVFGYGSVASTGRRLHRWISRLLPGGLLLAAERRLGYALQIAISKHRLNYFIIC